jgi:hypothetical protein
MSSSQHERSREQNGGLADAAAVIAAIAARFGIDVLYAFGSRAREAFAQTIGRGTFAAGGVSDLDLAALPAPGRVWNVDERVLMTAAFEDVFPAPRVDLVVLSEAPPFLALAAVSGELLFARDRVREANYQLDVLRRAGDLAPFERARRAHLLAQNAMTPSRVSASVVAERIAWIDAMLAGIRRLPLDSIEAFNADPRNAAAAESYVRRALEDPSEIP